MDWVLLVSFIVELMPRFNSAGKRVQDCRGQVEKAQQSLTLCFLQDLRERVLGEVRLNLLFFCDFGAGLKNISNLPES